MEKSNLMKELENEAIVKHQLDKLQIEELNRAMIQGHDLNMAAKQIFHQKNNGNKDLKLKTNEQTNFNATWRE